MKLLQGRSGRRLCVAVTLATIAHAMIADGATARRWTGSGDGKNWFNALNWSPSDAYPGGGDAVSISNGATILLTNNTAWLASLTITNATITFTNWFSELRATNITVRNSGVFTLPGAFTTAMPSNRVLVACSNFTLQAGSSISVDYAGYQAANGPAAGPTTSRRNGGGNGGKGGFGDQAGDPAKTSGSVSAPIVPGSGGCYTGVGGSGGGAVRIAASGTMDLRGTISANGKTRSASFGGGGAGGSIYLTCHTLSGSAVGLVRANGGNGDGWTGGGGGGRIAVSYTALAGKPGIRFSTAPGTSTYVVKPYTADRGTLYLPDAGLLSGSLVSNQFSQVDLYFPALTSWGTSSLTVSNCSLRIAQSGFTVRVTNNLLVTTSGEFGSCNLACGGNVVLTNGGKLSILVSPTNSPVPGYGGLLSVTGMVAIANTSWLYPYSDPTNGATPLLQMSNLYVYAGGGIDADANGYKAALGPGAGINGQRKTGGGYGGAGGWGSFGKDAAGPKGLPYGTASDPRFPGSGGGDATYGGYGGGAIRVQASGTVTIRGTLTANGGNNAAALFAGGSGGGIRIACDVLAGGNSGLLSANGGNGASGHGGGGGGGRIAVYYNSLSGGVWPGLRFSTAGSTGPGYMHPPFTPQQGTVYLPNTACMSQNMRSNLFTSVDLIIPGFANWAVGSLAVSNCSFRFTPTNFVLTVTNNLTIGPNGVLGVCDVRCGGNLQLSGGGKLNVYALPTNSTTRPGNGALVAVTNSMTVGASSWVYAWSDSYSGGSPLFRMHDLIVNASGGFDATAGGYRGNRGKGTGGSGERIRGGGYGGRGGAGGFGGTLGLTYGFTNAPLHPGSGGAITPAGEGGYGGGFVRIEAAGDITLDGSLLANGGTSLGYSTYPSGGSGGGVFVRCRNFSGDANGALQARGGVGINVGGGGGGGRVAVWYSVNTASAQALLADADNPLVAPGKEVSQTYEDFLGSINVTGGIGYNTGVVGTCVFLTVPSLPGTLFMFL